MSVTVTVTDREADVVVAVLPPDGDPVDRAAWTVVGAVDDDGDGCEVVVSRSPDRESVAVLVAQELRTVDLRDGALSAPVVLPTPVRPAFEEGLRSDPLSERSDERAIVWGSNAAPSVVRPAAAPSLDLPLEPGWTLSLVGPAVVDGGHTGHESRGLGGLYAVDEESARELPRLRAVLREWQVEAFDEEARFRCATAHEGRETVVHEETGRRGDGTTKLHWPPVVGPGERCSAAAD